MLGRSGAAVKQESGGGSCRGVEAARIGTAGISCKAYAKDKVEKWSASEDDRPYLRPTRTLNPWLAVLAIVVTAWLAALAYRFLLKEETSPRIGTASVAKSESPTVPSLASTPPVEHRLQVPAQPAVSLPTLDNSDSMARHAVVGLIGTKAFEEMVVPDQLIRRIVATIDNLPQPTAPTRVMPLNPVPGRFSTVGGDDVATIEGSNSERYRPYVRVLEMIDTHALVRRYIDAYPLFQRAYEELGNSGKYFNTRLIEAIDDLLTAPEIDQPIRVMRTKVLYQFADPDLETRSAGQKIMIRIGRENESRVKAKLLEVRRELIAAGTRHN